MSLCCAWTGAAAPGIRRVVLAVGTGTTLAGIAAGLGSQYDITGISALRGVADLEQRVTAALESVAAQVPATWGIAHAEHCGGFARVTTGLRGRRGYSWLKG